MAEPVVELWGFPDADIQDDFPHVDTPLYVEWATCGQMVDALGAEGQLLAVE